MGMTKVLPFREDGTPLNEEWTREHRTMGSAGDGPREANTAGASRPGGFPRGTASSRSCNAGADIKLGLPSVGRFLVWISLLALSLGIWWAILNYPYFMAALGLGISAGLLLVATLRAWDDAPW